MHQAAVKWKKYLDLTYEELKLYPWSSSRNRQQLDLDLTYEELKLLQLPTKHQSISTFRSYL